MPRESRVEIPSGSGNKYRYAYDPETQATRYLGTVGQAPALSEAEFMGGLDRPEVDNPSPKNNLEKEIDRVEKRIKEEHGLEDFSISLTFQGHLYLWMIEVPRGQRKHGRGSAAMQDLTKFADENDLLIYMSISQKDPERGTTSRSRLVKFYKRFDFVENKGRNKDFSLSPGMYRRPKVILVKD